MSTEEEDRIKRVEDIKSHAEMADKRF